MQAREHTPTNYYNNFECLIIVAIAIQDDASNNAFFPMLYGNFLNFCKVEDRPRDLQTFVEVMLQLAGFIHYQVAGFPAGRIAVLLHSHNILDNLIGLCTKNEPFPSVLLQPKYARYFVLGIERYLQLIINLETGTESILNIGNVNTAPRLSQLKVILAFFLDHYVTLDEARFGALYLLSKVVTPYEFYKKNYDPDVIKHLDFCKNNANFEKIKQEFFTNLQLNQDYLYLKGMAHLVQLREIRAVHYSHQEPSLQESLLEEAKNLVKRNKKQDSKIYVDKNKELRKKVRVKKFASLVCAFNIEDSYKLLLTLCEKHKPVDFEVFPELHFGMVLPQELLNSFITTYQCFAKYPEQFADNQPVLRMLAKWNLTIQNLLKLTLAKETIDKANLVLIQRYIIENQETLKRFLPAEEITLVATEAVKFDPIQVSPEEQKNYAKHGTTSPQRAKTKQPKRAVAKQPVKTTVETKTTANALKTTPEKPIVTFGNAAIQQMILTRQFVQAKVKAEHLAKKAHTDIQKLVAELCLGDVYFAWSSAQSSEEKNKLLQSCATHYFNCVRLADSLPESAELENLKTFLHHQIKLIDPNLLKPRENPAPLPELNMVSADILLPASVLDVISRLKKRDYKTYLVGGAVRDYYLQRTPKDYDLVTTAPFDVIQNEFGEEGKTIGSFGVNFEFHNGLIQMGGMNTLSKEGQPELVISSNQNVVVSYRTTSLLEDAKRRDVNINSLYYDPETKCVIDPLNALPDLLASQFAINLGTLQGPMHLLRCLRLAIKLQWSINAETKAIIHTHAKTVGQFKLPKTFYYELTKFLMLQPATTMLSLLAEFNLLQHALKISAADEKCVLALLKQHFASPNRKDDLLWAFLLHSRVKAFVKTSEADFKMQAQTLCREVGMPRSEDYIELIYQHYYQSKAVPGFSEIINAVENKALLKATGKEILNAGLFPKQSLQENLMPTLKTIAENQYRLSIVQQGKTLTLRAIPLADSFAAKAKLNTIQLCLEQIIVTINAANHQTQWLEDKKGFSIEASHAEKAQCLQGLIMHLMDKVSKKSHLI